MAALDARAKPLADAQLTIQLLQFIKTAQSLRQIKKGANETMKCLNRLFFFSGFLILS
jgi:U4/U6 small nuclear ribonucleoprotein SNU13